MELNECARLFIKILSKNCKLFLFTELKNCKMKMADFTLLLFYTHD
jgi:hypothetical protein